MHDQGGVAGVGLGSAMELADTPRATPHARPCRTKLVHSACDRFAAATDGTMMLSAAQAMLVVECVSLTVASHFLSVSNVRLPSVGHEAQSVWTAVHTPRLALWGVLGRAMDHSGERCDLAPA